MDTWVHGVKGPHAIVLGMPNERRGPKGGTTTTTPGGLRRKVFYLNEEEATELRRRAFEEEVTESQLVRDALRTFLGLVPK